MATPAGTPTFNFGPPPSAGGATTTAQPLGITAGEKIPPYDYVSNPALQPQYQPGSNFESGMEMPVQGKATYMPGDEKAPLNTPELIPQLQVQLVQAGLLNPNSVRPGVWGTAEQTAYKQVLTLANQQGVNAQQELNLLQANPTVKQLQASAQGGATSQRSFSMDNPVDIAATAQDTAVKLLGRRLDPNEEKAITGYVTMAQQAAANAGRTGKDYTAQASSSALTDQYLRQHDPADVLGLNAAQAMQNFYSLLKSPTGP